MSCRKAFNEAIEKMVADGEMERCARWEEDPDEPGADIPPISARAFADLLAEKIGQDGDLSRTPTIALIMTAPLSVLRSALCYMLYEVGER